MEEYLLVVLMELCESLRQLSYIDMHDYFFVYFDGQKYPRVKHFYFKPYQRDTFWGNISYTVLELELWMSGYHIIHYT